MVVVVVVGGVKDSFLQESDGWRLQTGEESGVVDNVEYSV